MCLVCVEYQKGKLTVLEAFQNLSEMEDTIPSEHYEEVMNMLTKEWEAQSYLDSLEVEEDLSDDDVYNKIEFEEDKELWDQSYDYGSYGNFDYEI